MNANAVGWFIRRTERSAKFPGTLEEAGDAKLDTTKPIAKPTASVSGRTKDPRPDAPEEPDAAGLGTLRKSANRHTALSPIPFKILFTAPGFSLRGGW